MVTWMAHKYLKLNNRSYPLPLNPASPSLFSTLEMLTVTRDRNRTGTGDISSSSTTHSLPVSTHSSSQSHFLNVCMSPLPSPLRVSSLQSSFLVSWPSLSSSSSPGSAPKATFNYPLAGTALPLHPPAAPANSPRWISAAVFSLLSCGEDG